MIVLRMCAALATALLAAPADPYNISFPRETTIGDYVALGRAVVPPLPVTCK